VSIRIPIGRREFAPSWTFTAFTVLVCALFILLGRWQWHRGEHRQAEWDRFSAGTERVLPLGARGTSEVPKFQRVSVVGRYDPDHQFLLDNRIDQGRAGMEVLTPLERPNGQVLLVDRGWVPFAGFRDHLPDVALRTRETLTVTGRVANLPVPGLALGRSPPLPQGPWPKVTTFPSMSQLTVALGTALEPHILLLDPQDADGYSRHWQPPGIAPLRNWSYALQWWCFALVMAAVWVRLSIRVRQETP
jgi:surfeit locus 1 family protein